MSIVSIIIPVYNAEKYLKKCIDSVLSQSLSDIEIICVNDGSTDGSLEILEEYEKKDNRIVIIDKTNGGPLSARNAGLKVAHGEYTGYVDSDDWIEVDMFEKLYNVPNKHDSDMVSSGYMLEGNYTTVHIDTIPSGFYGEDRIGYVRDNTIFNAKKKDTGLRGTVWCKLFKTAILKEVQFNVPSQIKHAEDKMIIISFILNCHSVYIMDKAFYHWRINSQSITHSGNSDFLYQIAHIHDYFVSLRNHPNFTEKMRVQTELYLLELMTKGINSRLGLSHSNLLRIDPDWMKSIEPNSRIILYGLGGLSEQYKRQLDNVRKDVVIVKKTEIELPELSDMINIDKVVIAIKNSSLANEVKIELIRKGIPEEKILWFPQPEFYWKYVEAEGLME